MPEGLPVGLTYVTMTDDTGITREWFLDEHDARRLLDTLSKMTYA